MYFQYDDGGREKAGYAGSAGDCVCRAIAIATERPYAEVYAALAEANKTYRGRKARGVKSARNGVFTHGAAFKRFMASIGWKFTAFMGIGTGCTVHLTDGELPVGRLIVSLSKHYTTVIDGMIHDTFDPQREVHVMNCEGDWRTRALKPGETRNENGIHSVQRRCVYGYWQKA